MPIPYRKSQNTGLTQRVTNVYIANPEDGMPSLAFQRQLVIESAGFKAFKELPGVSLQLTPESAAKEFPWLKASDDTDTGKKLTYADIYDIMYSLAMDTLVAQDERDVIQDQINTLAAQLK